MFWTLCKYNIRGKKLLGVRYVFNQIMEMLYALVLQFCFICVNTLGDKTNVSLDDIRQFINIDVYNTIFIKLLEQYYFAIYLVRAYILRPYSLAISLNYKYLVNTLTNNLLFFT